MTENKFKTFLEPTIFFLKIHFLNYSSRKEWYQKNFLLSWVSEWWPFVFIKSDNFCFYIILYLHYWIRIHNIDRYGSKLYLSTRLLSMYLWLRLEYVCFRIFVKILAISVFRLCENLQIISFDVWKFLQNYVFANCIFLRIFDTIYYNSISSSLVLRRMKNKAWQGQKRLITRW